MRTAIRLAGMMVAVGALACSVKEITFRPADESPRDAAPGVDSASGPGVPVVDAPLVDGPAIDAPLPMSDARSPPGSMENPAASCGDLQRAGRPSGVYWVRDPAGSRPAFDVYCEQDLRGGGWALLANSVLRLDGTTTAFWQLLYADRLSRRGTPAPDQNYYDGSLYLAGTEYMDIFIDLQDKLALAAGATAMGINPDTMELIAPTQTAGDMEVYLRHFASGWSSSDHDGDQADDNCATFYSGVAQHYRACWMYSFGSDAGEQPFFDGGVGPHVDNRTLVELGLALQLDGGSYSRVKRIARFTRW